MMGKSVPLSVREKWLALRADILYRHVYSYHGGEQDIRRPDSQVRRLMRVRREHPNYDRLLPVMRELRALDRPQGYEVVSLVWREFGLLCKWCDSNGRVMRFIDAELDAEGKADEELSVMLLAEAL